MIIHDFLDNDLYKFTVMNAIQKKFPDSEVVYRFVNRGNASFPPGFADALREEVEAMAGVVLLKEVIFRNAIKNRMVRIKRKSFIIKHFTRIA